MPNVGSTLLQAQGGSQMATLLTYANQLGDTMPYSPAGQLIVSDGLGWQMTQPGIPGQLLQSWPPNVSGQSGLAGSCVAWSNPILVWNQVITGTALASFTTATSALLGAAGWGVGMWSVSTTAPSVPAYAISTPGTMVHCDLYGVWGSTNLQPTFTFTWKLGTVAVSTSTATAVNAANTTTGGYWYASITLVTIAGGASVFAYPTNVYGISYGTNTPGFTAIMSGGTSGAITLTSAAVLDFFVACGTSNASNTLTTQGGQILYSPIPAL
jgi:hypothetical protein